MFVSLMFQRVIKLVEMERNPILHNNVCESKTDNHTRSEEACTIFLKCVKFNHFELWIHFTGIVSHTQVRHFGNSCHRFPRRFFTGLQMYRHTMFILNHTRGSLPRLDWEKKKQRQESNLNLFMSLSCDVARPLNDQGSCSRPFLSNPLVL